LSSLLDTPMTDIVKEYICGNTYVVHDLSVGWCVKNNKNNRFTAAFILGQPGAANSNSQQ